MYQVCPERSKPVNLWCFFFSASCHPTSCLQGNLFTSVFDVVFKDNKALRSLFRVSVSTCKFSSYVRKRLYMKAITSCLTERRLTNSHFIVWVGLKPSKLVSFLVFWALCQRLWAIYCAISVHRGALTMRSNQPKMMISRTKKNYSNSIMKRLTRLLAHLERIHFPILWSLWVSYKKFVWTKLHVSFAAEPFSVRMSTQCS